VAIRGNEFADKFNSMPKYVVSSTLETQNEQLNRAERRRRRRGVEAEAGAGRDIVVHGSARLAQALIEHDLVDELRLMVFPVVLGSGKRLFGDTSNKKRLRLTDSKTSATGSPSSSTSRFATRGDKVAEVA